MKPGSEVSFIGCSEYQIRWGSCDDPNPLLEEGKTYVVESVDIHSMHTKIKLVGYTGRFNSVCFIENET